jgi:hypothetical protein
MDLHSKLDDWGIMLLVFLSFSTFFMILYKIRPISDMIADSIYDQYDVSKIYTFLPNTLSRLAPAKYQ